MFEEIAKRIHQVAEAWQYACDAGDFEQANFHRGELSQLVHEMKSAQHTLAGGLCPVCRGSKVVFDGVLRQCRKCNGTGKAAKA